MRTWLIAECSSGLGLHLAEPVLDRKWNAVGTASNLANV